MKNSTRVVIGAAIFVLAMQPSRWATADEVTFRFEGMLTAVTDSTDTITSEFSIGESITGNYTFQSTATDTIADSTLDFYEDVIITAAVMIGGDFSMHLDPLRYSAIAVSDNVGPSCDTDDYFVLFDITSASIGPYEFGLVVIRPKPHWSQVSTRR